MSTRPNLPASPTLPPSAVPFAAVPLAPVLELARAAMANPDQAALAQGAVAWLIEHAELAAKSGSLAPDVAAEWIKALSASMLLAQPVLAASARLRGAVVKLAGITLHYAPSANAGRSAVQNVQQCLMQIGTDQARAQAFDLLQQLDADAKRRKLAKEKLPASGDAPTPETRARLRADVLDRLLKNGTLDRTQYEAALEIREVHDDIMGSQAPAAPFAQIKVDGGSVGSGPVAAAFGVMHTPLGRRFLSWRATMAGKPLGQAGNVWDIVRLVVIENCPITEAAVAVKVRRDDGTQALVSALSVYAAKQQERLGRKHKLRQVRALGSDDAGDAPAAEVKRPGAGKLLFPVETLALRERAAIHAEMLSGRYSKTQIARRWLIAVGDVGKVFMAFIVERDRLDAVYGRALMALYGPARAKPAVVDEAARDAAAEAWWAAELVVLARAAGR